MDHNSSQPNTPKAQPNTTPEVAQMLGLKMETQSAPPAPKSLPIVEAQTEPADEHSAANAEVIEHAEHQEEPEHAQPAKHAERAEDAEDGEQDPELIFEESNKSSWLKTILPYAAIFVVGIFLYYFYFSTFSFSTITNVFKDKAADTVSQIAETTDSKESALDQLKANNLEAYYAYMAQFYFDTSDPSILDPDADNSGNGLSNFQKFILNLNPKVYDTLGNGQADSQALAAGIDPYTGQALEGKRKELVDNYVNLEVASNRLAQSAFQNPQRTGNSEQGTPVNNSSQVAGASVIGARNAGATSAGNLAYTAPASPTPASAPVPKPAVQGSFTSPTTGSNLSSGLNGSGLNINPSVNASLSIPSLKINVPIVWTKDTKDFDRDLKTGVVHYPGTAMPGEIGTAYISGHSSNYSWAGGNYNRVFSTINRMKNGESFTITVTQQNGSKVKLHYKVFKQQQYLANDQAQLDNGSKSVVALSTCWPLNTTARRLVVFGELTQIDR